MSRFQVLIVSAAVAAWPASVIGDGEKPLVLKAIGSFYVGGERTLIQHSGGAGPVRPGHIWDGGMYVRYMLPSTRRPKVPVIMWSGGCHTGKSFETTPDGREGWDTIFVRAGHPVYIVDATYRGRSPISQESLMAVRSGDGAPSTLPSLLTCDEELAAPASGGFRLRNSNFPIDALDQYLAQLVPDWFFSAQNGPVPNSKALIALLEKTGPAVVLAHSQGGLTVYPTLIARPDLFKAYVAVEALGSCAAITTAGAGFPTDVPVLVMAGDPIDANAPPPFGIEGCKAVASANRELKLTVDYLPDAGIRGNSHMMMLDRNNKQIAERIMRWIDLALPPLRTRGTQRN
jgi:pimeloyl-ACP methyl ester carboxylesterase